MPETLQEFVSARNTTLKVDSQAGVVRGVKVLGLRSRNGRQYLEQALRQAVHLYEGAKVNINHAEGSAQMPRGYQDRIGSIRQVSIRENEGLFGDFHFNPKHALAEQLSWDAEHAPENLGFSHNVEAVVAREGNDLIVEEIVKVHSVDLVADPASTQGLFEQEQRTEAPPAAMDVTADWLREHRPELVEELLGPCREEIARLERELDEFRVSEGLQRQREQIRTLLREFQLPDLDTQKPAEQRIVSPLFVESLLQASTDKARRQLVEERARLVNEFGKTSCTPCQSREQQAVLEGYQIEGDVEGFVKSLCY